jgi:DNA-binding response OmpR family regulator
MTKNPTILYVDDDLSSLLLMKEQLKSLDINIITESNGKVGITTFMELKDEIDLVILDVHLPNINGYDVLLSIRQNDEKIPIIMVTATSFVENKDLILKMGANEYLIKPIPLKELLKIIKKYI